MLAEVCELKVFYTFGKNGYLSNYDNGFKKVIDWDIPLLSGYDFQFMDNSAKNPSLNSFWGIKNEQLNHEIKKFNPKAILIYGWSYYSHLKLMRHFKGNIPIWFRGDSTLLDKSNPLKILLRKFLLSWVYRFTDLALYVGTANKSYFKTFGLSDNQLVFVPHTVDNERFAEDQLSKSKKVRLDLNIPSDNILILFAGKFERKKNPEILLNAFTEINNKSIDLLFVGNGELEDKLKMQAIAYNSKLERNHIHFIDFKNQSEMPGIYQACDIFCLPSQGPAETWGLAINEAMAAGKAIICSDKVGCYQDLVEIDKNGWVFRSGDELALKNIICKLPEENLFKMGENSKNQIKNWNYKRAVEILCKTLEQKTFLYFNG